MNAEGESLVDQMVGKTVTPTTRVIYAPPALSPNVKHGSMQAENYITRPDVAAITESYFESGEALHGDRVTDVVILKEKVIHRSMIYLHAMGATVAEIAAQTGYTAANIYAVLRQPWAKQRLLQILKETGQDAIKHFHTHQVMPSLQVLQEIRDDTAAKKMERLAAANSILDRALGKPTVHVESDNTNRNVPVEMAKIDAELKSLRAKIDGETALPDAN